MALREGAHFAGYTVVRLLGSGGMGEVYLARHPRFPRLEALKVLRADLSADPDFQQRFNREAELASGLWHPHIVGVHDRGEFDGQLWITMDYVDGPDLNVSVRSHYLTGMPPQVVLAVVSAVADALDHAHHRGLLHRDVKPANIIMAGRSDDGGPPRALLSDFGIARPINDTTGLTATNMAVGTVNYSAPEQLMGGILDGRADQYGLAATAYYLLTGTRMFANLPVVAVISAHLTAPPPLPGAMRPDLALTDAVFARALAKDPRQRFERCSDFAVALASQLRITSAPRSQSSATASGPGHTQRWAAVRPDPTPPASRARAAAFDSFAPPGVRPRFSSPAPESSPTGPRPPPHRGALPPTPRSRWRLLRVAAVATAVLTVAVVVTYFVWPDGARSSPAPNAAAAQEDARLAAQHYLEALARGDAATALSLSANAPATAQWVSPDALRTQLALTPITDIAVTSAPSSAGDDPGSVQYVIVSARFGRTVSQTRIAVRRTGNDWKLDTTTAPVDIGTPGTSNAAFKAVALFGIATNGTTPVSVFPGALAVSSSNRFVDVTSQAPPVGLNALSPGASHPSIEPIATLNDVGMQASKTAVDNWEHHCARGVAPPPECAALSTRDDTVTITSAGDFSKAQLTFDPAAMVVTVSGSIIYSGYSATIPAYTVIYQASGTVDLTKDPAVYGTSAGHR